MGCGDLTDGTGYVRYSHAANMLSKRALFYATMIPFLAFYGKSPKAMRQALDDPSNAD